ncbi:MULTISPECIES: glutamate 5-kinase [unclassified Pseudomonas]|uniref:glutamate 5-kinase n=1 Tax=unclassified Pseudomonas TaxID=196821 RepID=UPI00244CF718|nr:MULTISPECIES: glutamate 5-kinase [unclassified Pseudomonas]MDG9922206.1 glutamate 5-kinase [Pseudomonas sp. GD04045]MDH0033701.1 glutamate 5-kinase [Pseudomonas sp. GD04019]
MRDKVTGAQRWVVKIGSALLTADGRGLDRSAMAVWVEQMVALREAGVELVLVSSGAVAAGMSRLGWSARPSAMHELQAAAAIGQMVLVQAWESSFAEHGSHTAQVLLTHDDLSDRKRYLNARSTLRTLVDLGVVPVINENDTVVTDEIRFGDNDTLAALVANLVEADLLVILTDRDGMFDADPRHNPDAQLIFEARADDPSLDAVAGGTGGALGRGGMQTKLRAARLAARSGAHTVIVGGRIERVLDRLKAGERLGTLLAPERGLLAARKQWLAGHLQTRGTLVLDAGAVKALAVDHKSLLPVGVREVQGSFRRGEMVVCVGPDGREVARGLANYSALEAQKIVGQPSDAIEKLLGYVDEPELVHRDNLILV